VLLKRLSLVGFKSFADRTRLDFDAGVNVIVGPNGSGKSNLLDAIAWAMGTQATRALRTEKMEDVVFAGTATRPRLNRAEVSVTFDNADGFLPLDLAEVTITRRLFRDGTSEYEINGAPCRLLDIQELLSDGGVGRRQHVLVGQGQVGEVLTARPQDHRMVIEEAAGITKHRSRRDRAVRRLAATDGDVERLQDLLREKRRQMRPLRRQANAAARHESVRAEARAIRTWIGAEALRDLERRRTAAVAEKAGLERVVAMAEEELVELTAGLAELRSEAGEVGEALARDAAAAARLETTVERLRRLASVARERRLALRDRFEGSERRRDDLRMEQEDLERELAETVAIAATAQARLEEAEIDVAALADEERSLAEQVQLPAEGLVANLRGDLRALESAASRDRRERDDLVARLELVGSRLDEERREHAFLQEEIRRIDAELDAVRERYAVAKARRESVQGAWEEASRDLADATTAVAAAAARVEALEAAASGTPDPELRRRVLETPGIPGTVPSLLDVPDELLPAVGAALGGWAEAFVAEDREILEGVVDTLKADGAGGLGIVLEDVPAAGDARSVAREMGIELLVDRLGPSVPGVVRALLADVVLVEGWQAAWRVVRHHPEVRAVTPEGDLATASGTRIAAVDGAGAVALETARVGLERAETRLARAESIHVAARRTFEQHRAEERTRLEAVEGLEARLAGLVEALGLVDRARSESEAEIARLERRRDAIDTAAVGRDERIAELRRRLGELAGEEEERRLAWQALEARRAEIIRRLEEARRTRDDAASAVARAAERRRMLEARLGAVRAEVERLAPVPVPEGRLAALGRIEEVAGRAIPIIRAHVASLRARQQELRALRSGAVDALEQAERRREELERTVREGKERAAVLAVELAEVDVRREAEAEGLRRDADVDEATALAAAAPEIPDGVTPEERLEALLADLRRMGPINPLAAAEYEEVAAEVELLEGQLADLEASRAELRKVIAALDEEMTRAFLAAFDEIARYYAENFRLVFPGGRGSLVLTDPDHPLETGVEVRAQPAGKRVGRLTLLSGGERSLAALAFLFAVFRARPSPFYVLDEVEAALDDANLRRFLMLVDGLRDSAQLVIITHQQQTMEAADILYGVTMEPGASSVVIARRMHPVSR